MKLANSHSILQKNSYEVSQFITIDIIKSD